MVPGLREELVTATIRSLPKPVRVQLVPAPDVARGVDAWMTEHTADWEDTVRAGDAAPSFREVFRRAVRELRDVDVPEDAFDDDRLPPHLRMTFRVVGDRGGVVDEGKDLARPAAPARGPDPAGRRRRRPDRRARGDGGGPEGVAGRLRQPRRPDAAPPSTPAAARASSPTSSAPA